MLTLKPSLLSRLIDEETKPFVSLTELQGDIRVHLIALLNTRLLRDPGYGMVYAQGFDERNVCRDVRACIERYEPRLKNVDVVLLGRDVAKRCLTIKISGLVEAVSAAFESSMEFSQCWISC